MFTSWRQKRRHGGYITYYQERRDNWVSIYINHQYYGQLILSIEEESIIIVSF